MDMTLLVSFRFVKPVIKIERFKFENLMLIVNLLLGFNVLVLPRCKLNNRGTNK